MERVLGVGGIFFKAKDPVKLKAWYRDHLGLPSDEHGETMFTADGDPGALLGWSPFPADTTYFAPSAAPFMINFRVKVGATGRELALKSSRPTVRPVLPRLLRHGRRAPWAS